MKHAFTVVLHYSSCLCTSLCLHAGSGLNNVVLLRRALRPTGDDTGAFVLQIYGAQRWRLHLPLDNAGVLPRFSSADFASRDLQKPV